MNDREFLEREMSGKSGTENALDSVKKMQMEEFENFEAEDEMTAEDFSEEKAQASQNNETSGNGIEEGRKGRN